MGVVKSQGSGMKMTGVADGVHKVHTDEPTSIGGTDTAANPLQTVLGALSGCEQAASFFVAKKMKLPIGDIDYEVVGEVDINVKKSCFKKVTVTAKVSGDVEDKKDSTVASWRAQDV